MTAIGTRDPEPAVQKTWMIQKRREHKQSALVTAKRTTVNGTEATAEKGAMTEGVTTAAIKMTGTDVPMTDIDATMIETEIVTMIETAIEIERVMTVTEETVTDGVVRTEMDVMNQTAVGAALRRGTENVVFIKVHV